MVSTSAVQGSKKQSFHHRRKSKNWKVGEAAHQKTISKTMIDKEGNGMHKFKRKDMHATWMGTMVVLFVVCLLTAYSSAKATGITGPGSRTARTAHRTTPTHGGYNDHSFRCLVRSARSDDAIHLDTHAEPVQWLGLNCI